MKLVELTAADFCTSVRDGTHDSPKPVEGDGKPLVTTRHMKNGRITLDDAYLIAQSDFDKVNERSQVHQWDVLISMIGTLGELVLVRDEPDYAIKNIGLFKTKSKYDGMWLYYFLQSPSAKNHILTLAQGSTQQYLSLKTLRQFPLSVPESEADQRAICEFLGTLDDKIELNQKMNQTLEDIAKAIFKSWFVDFDPVRAKVEGRPAGLPAEISDLFPDAFEDSEIGEIPAGWNERRFSDCEIEIESGRRPKGGIDKSLSEGIPSIGAESIAPAGIFDFSKVKYVTEEFAAKMKRGKVQNFDVALYKDGGKPGQFIPRVGVYGDEFPFSECYVNEHVFLLRSRYLGQSFLYRMVSSDDFLHQLTAKGSAKAAQPGLNQEEVASNKLIVPSDLLLRVFNEMSEPLLKRQFLLGKEIKVLSELRDTLLPKLISGELRIPDAEKFLEEAGV